MIVLSKPFLSETLAVFAKIAKETGFLPYCLVKCMACLLDRG